MLDFVGKLGELKQAGEMVVRDFPPDFVIRASVSAIMKFVLQETLKAGPPPDFGERFHLDESQAKKIYDAVLTAALQRHERKVIPLPVEEKEPENV